MAVPSIPLALVPANENAPVSFVAIIPTLLSRLHLEIANCDDVEQLVDVSVKLQSVGWEISPWARCQLYRAIQRRCAEIRRVGA